MDTSARYLDKDSGSGQKPQGRSDRTLTHLGYVEEDNYRAYFGGYVAAVRGFLDGKPVNVIAD